jgi:hypothetical protein
MKLWHPRRRHFLRCFREPFRARLYRLRMKPCVFPILLVLCSAICGRASAGPQSVGVSSPQNSTGKIYDVTSFAAELHRLDVALRGKPSAAKIEELRKSVPANWNVSTPEHTYSISTKPLRDRLNASSVAKAETWVEQLEVEIKSAQGNTTNPVSARPELNKILAGPGFEGVHPPSALDLFRQRVAAWLGRMILRLFENISRHPIGAEFLFWLLLIAGVAFVALCLFRYLSRGSDMNSFRPASSIVTTRTWQDWIRAARQAAARGDFREAVHSAYWAGIARLEETGALTRDRTKTPREYLGLVKARYAAGDARENYKEPLAALTSRMERIWYAKREAKPEDFSDSLRQLEALGCPLE